MTPQAASQQEDQGKVSAIPPYVPFRTLHNFLEGLKATHLPSRIDRSVMPSMSGALQGQLTAALRYLQLVTPNGTPTDRLTKLVSADGGDRQKLLRELIAAAYPFLFKGFDLERATTKQLEEQFMDVGAGGATVRKCLAFFMGIAKAADIKLSPHLKPFKGASRPNRSRKSTNGHTNQPHAEPPPTSAPPETGTWEQMLLSKFPNFDPSWPDDVKTKWFAAFDQLMKQGAGKGKD